MISLNDAVKMVFDAMLDMNGGEIYVKKIPSMNILDIAKAVDPNRNYEIIGIRPGEKIHEQMIGLEDAPFTYSYDGHFKILPFAKKDNPEWIGSGRPVDLEFQYTSDNNSEWMSSKALSEWIEKNALNLGNI